MRCRPLHVVLAGVHFLSLPAFGFTLDSDVFIDTTSFSYSEVAPIKQFADSLEGPPIDRGSRAFTSNRLSIGQRIHLPDGAGTVEYAVISRLDYSLKFTPDTATLFYTKENGIRLDDERVHQVFLDANHIRAKGIRAGYIGTLLDDWQYQIHVSYLNADEMLYGGLEGDLTSLEDDAKGTLDLDYFYSEDVFFDREPSNLTANGYTVDAAVQWRVTTDLTLNVTVRDLASEIVWKQQDRTIANATSNRKLSDTRVRAVLTWQETEETLRQSLPRQYSVKGAYTFNNGSNVTLEHFVYDNHAFQRVGYRYDFNSDYYLSTFYDATAQAVGVEMASPYVTLGIFSDDTKIEHAKMFGLFLALKAPLKF